MAEFGLALFVVGDDGGWGLRGELGVLEFPVESSQLGVGGIQVLLQARPLFVPVDALQDWGPVIERQRGAIIAELCRRGPIWADAGATAQ